MTGESEPATGERTCLLLPEDLIGNLTFEADCTVGSVERHTNFIAGATIKPGDRVTRLNDEEVVDRCEMRAAIAELADTEPNVPVLVHFTAAVPTPTGRATLKAGDDYFNVYMGDAVPCTVPAVPDPAAVDESREDVDPRLEVDVDSSEHDDTQSLWSPAANAGSPMGAYAGHPVMMSMTLGGAASIRGLIQIQDDTAAKEFTLAHKLGKSLTAVDPGRCVIVLGDQHFNPLDEIETLARTSASPAPTVVDFGERIRRRISPEALVQLVVRTFQSGGWTVIVRGSKSMRLLEELERAVRSINADEGCDPSIAPLACPHPDARLIICAEPHPYFPAGLLYRCKSIKLRTNFSQSTLMFESIGTSMSVRQLATSGEGTSSAGRKVRMASVVSVVDIEPREVAERPEEPAATRVNVSGTVTLTSSFGALPGDRFYGISFRGRRDQVAIASSLGNVYIVDTTGASLASYHLHDAAVWDVAFANEEDFITGGEDHSACLWKRDTAGDTVTCVDNVRCPNDVYTISYTRNKEAVAIGGLMSAITVRSAASGRISEVPLSTSAQAICSYSAPNAVACAGGDGSVSLVDCSTATVLACTKVHSKKAACITSLGDTVVSGSYDGKMRMWDTRVSGESKLQCLKFSQYVTGVAAEDNFMAACVGASLYIWDVRNLSQVLGGHPKAWRDVSRAICIDADRRTVVTASPDSTARFWSF